MNTDSYQFQLNRTHREKVLREARREQLIRSAAESSPKTPHAFTAALLALVQSLFR